MCAYKLCKVEFRYWGMQAKIEQFIHDVGEHQMRTIQHAVGPCLDTGMLPFTQLRGEGIVEPG